MALDIALILLSLILVEVGVRLHSSMVDGWRARRRENVQFTIHAFEWSTRHRPFVPLLVGLTDEVAVKRVVFERKGGDVYVELELAWWAPRCLYNRRLGRKVKFLLQEGGVGELVWSRMSDVRHSDKSNGQDASSETR